jgi:aminopeptidase N
VAGDTFPVTYWVLPENLAKGKVLFEDILRQMAFFESVFGPYPFRGDKYGVAETPHLGMEHQSIIAYGNNYKMNRWGEDRGYDELHLHEFAHEWWANLVTCKNWKDFWIHESFASYAQALYAEHVGGERAYFQEMSEQIGHRNQAAIAPREAKSTAEMYFGDRPGSPGGDIYSKGAWVLHSLRWLVGDEAFFRALRRMAYPDPALEKKTDGSACRFATTEELIAIVEKECVIELDWFFEVYLRQPALPELTWREQDGKLLLAWQSPTKEPFPMPVEVKLGDAWVRVECPLGKGELDLGGQRTFEVDPRFRALRTGVGGR